MTDVTQTPRPITQKGYIKALLFSLLTLASGVVIGAAAMIMIRPEPTVRPEPSGLEWITEQIVHMMVRELSLTPEQREQAYPIVKEHFGNIDEIRGDVREQIQKEIEGMNEELLAIFDESQKQRYQENIQRMGTRFPGIGRRRGFSGPGQRGSGQRGSGQRGSGQRGSGQRGPGSGQRREESGQRSMIWGQNPWMGGQEQNPWMTTPGQNPWMTGQDQNPWMGGQEQNPWMTRPGMGDNNDQDMNRERFRRDGRRRQWPPTDPNNFPSNNVPKP